MMYYFLPGTAWKCWLRKNACGAAVVFYHERRLVLRRDYKSAFSGTAFICTFWHYCRCTGYNGRMPFNVRLFAARYFVYYGRAGRRCRRLICLLGYTTLPFLMLTPVALLSTKLSFTGILVLAAAILAGLLWMVYLLVRSLQSVYLIDFKRALATVLFSFLLIYTALVLPFQFLFKLLMLKFS